MDNKSLEKYFCKKKSDLIISIVTLVIAIILLILKNLNNLLIFFSFLSLNIFIIFFIKYQTGSSKIKKFDKNYFRDVILEDLKKKTTKNYSAYRIIFTDEYLISLKDLKVVYYKDIVWAYPYTMNYGGLVTLVIKLKNKKTYDVAVSTGNADNYYMINEFIKIIKKKNTKVLVGFNNENKKKFKDIKNK